MRKKLYLVDGSSYIYRAFYAIKSLSNSKGLPTNALYGFTRMLLKLIKEETPDKLAVIFDTKEPTFRDELYTEYKANREEPPNDLIPQFQYFQPIVDALSIKNISKPGFEADDIIGTIARKAVDDGYEVVIVTGDKDFMQIVGDHLKLYDTMKEKWIGLTEVKEKFGVEPAKVIDIMSLIGDTSDNIPGVKGIGDKTAVKLIKQFGSLEGVLANIDKVSNSSARNALKDGVDSAKLSKQLVTIKLDSPVDIEWDDFDINGINIEKAKKIFSELEFFKLLRELLPAEDRAEVASYHIVSDETMYAKLKELCKTEKSLAMYFIDSTVDASFPFVGFGLSFLDDQKYYVPLGHDMLEGVTNIGTSDLREFFEGLDGKTIYIYDAKDVLKKLKHLGIELSDVQDVRLMSYVLNPSNPADLATLSQQILGLNVMTGEDKKKRTGLTIKEASEISCTFSDAINKLAVCFEKDLAKNKALEKLYNEIESPLLNVLLKMEDKGVLVDLERLKKLSKEYGEKIEVLESQIYKEAQEKFTINSPKQLSHILFEKLNLPAIKKTKTGFSTDSSVLEELAEKYKLPALIIEYRTVAKLKSTYIDALPLLVDKKTGRIHTTFNQAVTATGRLSSSDPNLQNVPARTSEGQRIRKAFISDRGKKLLSADYSQIELRILAHISGEKALVDAFERGEDIHSTTAARIFGVSEDKVDSNMRSAAKTVNFGVLYGQGAYGLSKQLGIEVDKADAYIKNYYENYPTVKELKDSILKDAAKNGYVETLSGRRRYIPDINSPNNNVRSFAERTAFNAVFQGTAADIIKMAMLDLGKILEKKYPDISMLLQVHDELVFELPPAILHEFSEVVRDKMCNVIKLHVPLEVTIGTGDNWAECKG